MNHNIKYLTLCAACFVIGVLLNLAIDYIYTFQPEKGTEWEGGLFFGDLTENEQPDGEGRFVKEDMVYSGSWSAGKFVAGRIESDKYIYEGEVNGFKFNGYGVCRYKDGHTYWGYWRDDNKHGLGRLESANGKQSFGFYENGVLNPIDNHDYEVGDVVYGIDVSWHQGVISWQDLYFSANRYGRISESFDAKSPFLQPPLFTYIKATEGSTLVDSRYECNYDEAKRCGVHVGTYHFLSMQSSGKEQAEHFISHSSLQAGDLPPALDIEKVETNRKISDEEFVMMIPIAKDWLRIIEEHFHVKPIIYTNVNIYNKFVKDDTALNTYDLWIAYPDSVKPDIPNCIIWQFSHHGKIHGITDSYVDMNMYHKDYHHLTEYIKQKGIK